MTRRSENQSYEDTLYDAVQDMHQQMPRGNQPSSRAWSQFAQEAGIPTQTLEAGQVSADSGTNATPRSHKQRIRSSTSARSNSYLGWSTWLAVAIVVAIIGASANFLLPGIDGGDNTTENSIALAPGTPDLFTALASPSASPDLYSPVHGPEFACNAEPLTEEQVYQIVLNPSNGWSAKAEKRESGDAGLFESSNHWMNVRFEREMSESYVAVDDPDLVDPITETANAFWNCLMNGSAYQVWSMMEPSAVQSEILTQHPVFRDEEMIRRHIQEWGPRRYSASIYHVFPDLGDVPSNNASMRVVDTYGGVRLGYSGEDPWKALVLMQSQPHESEYHEKYLLLQIAPDGTWWVSMIFHE